HTILNPLKSLNYVHFLSVEHFFQTILTLDHIVSMASASLYQPEASPSSPKHAHLEERITSVHDEDTVSLGGDEDDLFADSDFDDIDAMVLDRYNTASMDLGAEARLFRQVPSARALMTDTDTLPLHVRYTPALYIASSIYNMSCCVSSQAYICSHDIHDARCANCKGKMADGSEMSGAFWLLDSGASRHFTGDLSDFASYQALKHKHYAKTANGVALIAGVGTVILRCLDRNTGIEKVVKLSQVLHIPDATARLISMGKMFRRNYRITGDKRGISLIGKANRLWFDP